jgi:hypothetical protein
VNNVDFFFLMDSFLKNKESNIYKERIGKFFRHNRHGDKNDVQKFSYLWGVIFFLTTIINFIIMQKYLSIFLTLNAQPMLISATQVTGVVMSLPGAIQIRYHDGGTATLTLSDNMAANDITASNLIADQIVAALETSWTKVVKIVTTQADQALQGIGDAAGAAVTVTSVVLA